MELVLIFLGGLLVGGSTVFGLTRPKKNDEPVIVQSYEGTEEAIKNLTALDITEPICRPDFIKENGDLLCRELTCLQFTRGVDSQTDGSQCESISNISNKIQIEKWCNQHQDLAVKQECIDLFWKRN